MLESIFRPRRPDPAVISFRTMRRMIGVLGIALPIILFAWSVLLTKEHFLLDSISSYYHTNLRDVLVGILCAVSFFFFALNGYDELDFLAYKVASASALGVAFFPAFIKSEVNPHIHIAPNLSAATNAVHCTCAALFFLTLAFISAFLFTKTSKGNTRADMTGRKRARNGVYVACGSAIFACIVLLLILNLLPDSSPILRIDPVFWIEAVALFAFGFSWLVKGEVLLADK
jgi:hypothetical protein